ncbi:thioredoxin family protein [Listeria grayi]|uniref:thioredoxin family protein n=1 Tax=Listeria grayi TaxID=1641 RepID=UPI002892C2E6|nr:thioredoxin family protein [Listeria grayi]
MEYQPLLEEILGKYRMKLDYYNTIEDRVSNKVEFQDVMSKLNITGVPSLIVINDGKVVQKLDGSKLESETKGFLLKYVK